MPDGQEAALQTRVAAKTSRNLGEACLHVASDEAQGRRKRGQFADIVSELRRAASVKGLARRVDHHGEGAVQVAGGAPLAGEKVSRGQGSHFALHLDGDPLPGAKMPRIALGRRAGR